LVEKESAGYSGAADTESLVFPHPREGHSIDRGKQPAPTIAFPGIASWASVCFEECMFIKKLQT
jgi:hypothetical protein